MNAEEITNVVPEMERNVQTTAIESPPVAKRDAGLRYALLIAIALLSGWLAYTVISSLNEIDQQMQAIRAACFLPLRR
jgi:hypothetical protein